MSNKRELAKKETEKKQKEREKMGDRKGDDNKSEAANDDMLASMKAGFDNVSKQIGTNSEETRKEMVDIRESIQNLGSMLREELVTFKEEMGNRLEIIDRGIEAHGRDIADIQERVVEIDEWNAELKGIIASSIKQQRRLQEKVTDLEGRSRRNNVRIWGVPEGTEKDSVPEFIERLIREKLEFGEDAHLQIQRAHRALAPKPAPDKNPRAIIVNFQQYQTKDDILKKAWQTKIKIGEKAVTFDHDYPAEVAAKRRNYAGLKRVLKGEGIKFQSPLTSLRVHWKDGVQTYGSPQEAARAMEERGMKVDGLIEEEQPTLEQQLEAAYKWRRAGEQETDVAGRARKELRRFTRRK